MWPWILRLLLALAALVGAAAVSLAARALVDAGQQFGPVALQAMVVLGSLVSAVLVLAALFAVLSPPRGPADASR
jgi:drug/metabolite transporter (DMT)-like permease